MIFNESQLSLLQIDPLENSSLETLLNKNLTLNQLLAIKNIQPKIKSSFTYFIKYCQRNQQFCNQLIDIGIKSPYAQTSNADQKQFCYVATDALTCDQDIVADLLIIPDKTKQRKTSSANQSDGFEQIEENIETQADNSAAPQQTELIDQSLSEQEKFQKRCKYLKRVLNYILEHDAKQLNENCINYMIKALNCLIRKKGDQFLQFLDKKPQYLKRLIQLNNFSSINQFLIKIISDDDIHYQNFRKIKEIIIEGTLNKLKSSINDQDFIERLDFLDELFQTNKYASQDDRTQLQKLSDVFSQKTTIQVFYVSLLNPKSPIEFNNSICYLSNLVKRMNVDQEVDPYCYSNEKKEETMIFEMDILFKKFPEILKSGFSSLANLPFADQYKQKMMESRFYDLLVLLTRNSRFSNSSKDIKHPVSELLKGSNIIFQSSEEKVNIIKELIQQFFTQTKSGINRIAIVALLEKIISMQIYQQENHKIQQKINGSQTTNDHSQNKDTKKSSVTQQVTKTQKDEKQEEKNHQQDCNQAEDKKKKITQFKAKLKLDIKKFSSQNAQATQKTQEKTQVSNKKIQEQTNIKKLQSSLKKTQVIKILEFLSDLLKSSAQFSKISSKIKLKKNETEITALLNKIIMLLCNSINWIGSYDEQLTKQKDDFISQVQSFLTFFNFQQICRNYSTTLATSKHPNATAKEKTNPELNFIAEFVKNYSKRKEQPADKNKESSTKNLELSDSQFKSQEQDQEEEIHAEKCSLEDFKRLTGFKFQTDKISNKPQPIDTDRSSSEPKPQINFPIQENQQQNISQVKTQTEKVQEKQPPKLQEPKKQPEIQVQSQTVSKKEETKQQNEQKPTQKKDNISLQQKKNESQVIKILPGHKILPVQFYVRHRMIFV